MNASAKTFSKGCDFYQKHCNLKPPYFIILEKSFLIDVIQRKVDLEQLFTKYLKSWYLSIMSCLLHHTKVQRLLDSWPTSHYIASNLCLNKNEHSVQCIFDFVQENYGYCVASMDVKLAKQLRNKVPTVPIIFKLEGKISLFMEKPSKKILYNINKEKEKYKMIGIEELKPKLDNAKHELFVAPKLQEEKKTYGTLMHMFRQSKAYKKERRRKKNEKRKLKKLLKEKQKIDSSEISTEQEANKIIVANSQKYKKPKNTKRIKKELPFFN